MKTENAFTPTIGIEVHAELKTQTKMFCRSRNDPHAAEANTHVCPVCMAHPGTLPVINKDAVKHVLHVGLALGSELASYTEFDRKNYFYPDIPKGYQISQYKYPLVKGGELAGVEITRVHLEEDTARSLHDQGEGSIVDFNRAGVPLMELVTEPVIHDSKTAGTFARELQLLLRSLGVSDANMEKGEMRVEANISISQTNKLGTKVEVKNLNSFKAVESAINFEIKRQQKLLERGESIVQETRGWDENHDRTFSQRSKETSEEYRYFPDPDLPSLDLELIDDFHISRLKETTKVYPAIRRREYSDIGIKDGVTEVLVANIPVAEFMDQVIGVSEGNKDIVRLASNYVSSDVLAFLSEKNLDIKNAHVDTFVALMNMLNEGKIGSRVAKDMLYEVVFEGSDPEKLTEERGLLQDSSEDAMRGIVKRILRDNVHAVDEYISGKESSLQYLIGQGMKESRGSANPQVLAKLFVDEMSRK